MEIIERKENPLLNRVEISFRWNHSKGATPTLSDMVAAAAKADPATKKELICLKIVTPLFAPPQTPEIASIYGDKKPPTLGRKFVQNRHNAIHSPGDSEEPAAPEPVAEESSEEEVEADSEEGGDE